MLDVKSGKRMRVRGPGPDRSELPMFFKIGELPNHLIENCLDISRRYSKLNDLKSRENYKIKNYCSDLMEMLPETFRHILLQEASPGLDSIEDKYDVWKPEYTDEPIVKWLRENFEGIYRARISILYPGTMFDWHIDANTSVGCRCSIILDNSEASFEINKRGEIASQDFNVGDIVFTNTGWPHRVSNNTEKERTNLVFGINYENLKDRLPLLDSMSEKKS